MQADLPNGCPIARTLGLGDMYATFYLRMLTSIEALSGMLPLSWSASIALAIQHVASADQDPRR